MPRVTPTVRLRLTSSPPQSAASARTTSHEDDVDRSKYLEIVEPFLLATSFKEAKEAEAADGHVNVREMAGRNESSHESSSNLSAGQNHKASLRAMSAVAAGFRPRMHSSASSVMSRENAHMR